ncbi:MAG TPA: ABC transporter permease [Candidatus Limnocylindrales bacterium]|jgi:sodium transport system permease protein|nr:ABC transporter permease [Candidatus Limnocylindrales bacterium]
MSLPAPEPGRPQERIFWRQVWILYLREMRAAFREKTIVLNSILIPIFLYPFLMWAVFTGFTFVMGQTQGFASRVLVTDWPANHPKLRLNFLRDDQIQLLDTPTAPTAITDKIKRGQLDAWLEFLPADQTNAALPGNFQVRISYDQSKDRSAEARGRLADAIDQYRRDWLKRDARRRGIDEAHWQGLALSARNVASNKEMGAFIMGMLAPVIFVVMVAIGCLNPAVDATAGERERSTWETLMSTAASRLSVATAKYLYVASLGSLAGILNLSAVILTAKPIFGPLFEKAGRTLDYTIPLPALPLALVAGLLLAGFVAAGMMIFAAFARTFKEGQSMITPFYMLVLVPVIFLQSPGLQFSLPLALVPIVNLTLMIREVLTGTFHWALIAVSFTVSLVLIALCLRFAAYVLQFEDVLTGSYAGSFTTFLKERVLRSRTDHFPRAAKG